MNSISGQGSHVTDLPPHHCQNEAKRLFLLVGTAREGLGTDTFGISRLTERLLSTIHKDTPVNIPKIILEVHIKYCR